MTYAFCLTYLVVAAGLDVNAKFSIPFCNHILPRFRGEVFEFFALLRVPACAFIGLICLYICVDILVVIIIIIGIIFIVIVILIIRFRFRFCPSCSEMPCFLKKCRPSCSKFSSLVF